MRVAAVMELAKAELARGGDSAPPDGALESEPQREASRTLEPISYLRDCASEHHRLRRCVEQGGEIPVHFITLTTAIYHWRDLANVLREYEKFTTACRGGRRDPFEPGEEQVAEEKRRVQIYTGVVAWFCAMKLELITRYVMESDDHFGVFEWGSGGIVHVHLLRWLSGRGRYDTAAASVPSQRRRSDGLDLASCHQDELAEWDLSCPEKFPGGIWDVECPVPRSSEPLGTDDESDGETCSDSAPSVGSEDPDAKATRTLDDDEQWKRMPGGCRVRDAKGQPVREAVPPADVEEMKALVPLLQDPKWHPAAPPPPG